MFVYTIYLPLGLAKLVLTYYTIFWFYPFYLFTYIYLFLGLAKLVLTFYSIIWFYPLPTVGGTSQRPPQLAYYLSLLPPIWGYTSRFLPLPHLLDFGHPGLPCRPGDPPGFFKSRVPVEAPSSTPPSTGAGECSHSLPGDPKRPPLPTKPYGWFGSPNLGEPTPPHPASY
jgi:hypothetical protein